MNIPSLNRAKRQLDLMRAQDLEGLDIRIVVNRLESRFVRTIHPSDVEQGLGHEVSYTIANDHAVMRAAIDRGVADRRDQTKNPRSARIWTRWTPGSPPPLDWSVRAMWNVRKSRSPAPEHEGLDPSADPRLLAVGDAGAFEKRDTNTELKVELHQRLLDLINLSALDQMSREQIEAEVGDIVAEELGKQNHALNQGRAQAVGCGRPG
jgi:hypothetical protein